MNKYFVRGKDEIVDPDAPVVSNEFIDKQEEGDYTGQTIEVRSKTKLEEDLGTGEAILLRTYEFGVNPEMFKNGDPSGQDIFNSHMKGILGMLWGDGLQPVMEMEPKIIFSKDRSKYLIMVGARPSIGQSILETPRTLSEIVKNDNSRNNTDALQRGVPVSSTKKKATKRTTKTLK